MSFNLEQYGITKPKYILRNLTTDELYENSLKHDIRKTYKSSTGALLCYSGEKTGRSPKDKRIVDEPSTTNDIGKENIFNTKIGDK
jgi:phosphoenolpyruvate carboxykinase (ATP)